MASSKPTPKPAKKATVAAPATKPSKSSKPSSKSTETKTAKQTSKSTERVADSDLDSDSTSEDESSSSSGDENREPGSASGEDEESSSGSASGSGSDSESDSDDDDLPSVVKPSKSTTKSSNAPAQKPKPSTNPAPPFTPPAGFTPLPPSSSLPSTHPLSTHSLSKQGKQLLHITAPASLPLSTMHSLRLPSLAATDPGTNTSAPLLINGEEYTFTPDIAGAHTSSLLLRSEKGVYNLCGNPIAQTLHLQRVVRLPGAVREAAGKREARVQPRGLRMRFRPAGFGEGECGVLGDSDGEGHVGEGVGGEEEEERPVFKKHKSRRDGEGEVGEVRKKKSSHSRHESRSKEEKRARKEKRRDVV